MRIASLSAFERHLAEAAPDFLPPVYLLLTKESYEAKQAQRAVVQAFLSAVDSANGLIALDGDGLRLSTLSDSLEGGQLFAARRVVAICQADKLAKPLVEEIQRYLDRPIPSLRLLLSAATLLRTTNFYKCLERHGIIFDPGEGKEKEREVEIVQWITAYFLAAAKVIEVPAAVHLARCCAGERASIYNEMEKLLCYVGERREVSVADVEMFVTFTPVESIWQLAEALLCGDGAKARRIARQAMASESDFFAFLRLMRSQFQSLCQVASILAHGGGSEAVLQQFPHLRGNLLQKNVGLAQRVGIAFLRNAITKIDAIELKAKNSLGSPYLLVDILLTSLIVQG